MAQILIRDYRPSDLEQVREIFWLTSARSEFSSQEERAEFRHRYLEWYLTEICLVALEGERVAGYIIASYDTFSMRELWLPHMAGFEAHYHDFPAHLHINCHPSSQGKGVGSLLIQGLETRLRTLGVRGVHLITAERARNVSFYLRSGFLCHASYEWKDKVLVLLAKKL